MDASPRFRNARRLATRVGGGAAILSLFNAAVTPMEPGGPSWSIRLLLAPALGFVLLFALVFPLALAFPPASDEARWGQRFPGARKVVWPMILCLAVAVFWWVVRD